MYSIPSEVKVILNKFSEAGFQIFIVGGAVRDLLMNRPVHDWDFTTDAKPEEILKIFPDGFYDNKFGTVGINSSILGDAEEAFGSEASSNAQARRGSHRLPGRSETEEDSRWETGAAGPAKSNPEIFEITTMRKEGDYKDHRHPVEVSWTNKIEEDLARRDFTINAMALGMDNGQWTIVDPFFGQKDLEQGLIKAVGEPAKRFQEDALRLIRAVRFASQLNFEIEEKTLAAIKQNSNLISQIAWERIRDEFFKLLASKNAYDGLLKLRKTGILPIILPELEKTSGIIQEGPKHDRVYEILDHSLRTMRETPSEDPLVKFAALLHDVGKAETVQKDSAGNVTFFNHDIVGGRIVTQIAKRFNLSKKQTDKLYKLVRYHMFTMDENQTDSAIRRFIKNIGLENIEDMMALRVGDRLGGDTRKPVSWRMEKFQERIKQVLVKPFSITDLKVNGQDVMEILRIPPSQKVGEILNKLFEEVLEDSSKNERKYLLEKTKQLK